MQYDEGAVEDALITLLQTITAVTDTTYNVTDHVPLQQMDYEGFVATVIPPSTSYQAGQSVDFFYLTPNWQIRVLSPSLSPLQPKERQRAMYGYAKKIRETFVNTADIWTTNYRYTLELSRDYFRVPYEQFGNYHHAWFLEFSLGDVTINKEC